MHIQKRNIQYISLSVYALVHYKGINEKLRNFD